jgi:hypothetical protein
MQGGDLRLVIVYPNGQRSDALFSDVPRVGDHVRLQNAKPSDPALVVEHVLWTEIVGAGAEPNVVICVREHAIAPNA